MYNDCDICFLSGLFPVGMEEKIIKNSKISVEFAANAFQHKLANGLLYNNVKSLQILNSLFINSFPRGYKKPFIKSSDFKLDNDGSIHKNIGFINLYYLRYYFKYFSLKHSVSKWANIPNKNKILLGYTAFNPTLELFKYAKQLNPNIHTCLIVPDLPQMCSNKNRLYNLFLNRTSYKLKKYKGCIDSYVILTEQMSKIMEIDKNYVVIEGIVDSKKSHIDNYSEKNIKDNIKRILYTGTLNKKYGITNLIEAFKQIDCHNYRLIICGTGDAKDNVIDAAKNDKRILYHGICSQDRVLELQKEATVLVNPRQNNEEYTKYSFPSKNLEYLSSGTPMIAYKLDGIPNEYDSYIYYVDNNSIEALRDKIKDVCEKHIDDLHSQGIKAREFVMKQKNEVVQARRILEMIEAKNAKS